MNKIGRSTSYLEMKENFGKVLFGMISCIKGDISNILRIPLKGLSELQIIIYRKKLRFQPYYTKEPITGI